MKGKHIDSRLQHRLVCGHVAGPDMCCAESWCRMSRQNVESERARMSASRQTMTLKSSTDVGSPAIADFRDHTLRFVRAHRAAYDEKIAEVLEKHSPKEIAVADAPSVEYVEQQKRATAVASQAPFLDFYDRLRRLYPQPEPKFTAVYYDQLHAEPEAVDEVEGETGGGHRLSTIHTALAVDRAATLWLEEGSRACEACIHPSDAREEPPSEICTPAGGVAIWRSYVYGKAGEVRLRKPWSYEWRSFRYEELAKA